MILGMATFCFTRIFKKGLAGEDRTGKKSSEKITEDIYIVTGGLSEDWTVYCA